jgi:hypothetical protein
VGMTYKRQIHQVQYTFPLALPSPNAPEEAHSGR